MVSGRRPLLIHSAMMHGIAATLAAPSVAAPNAPTPTATTPDAQTGGNNLPDRLSIDPYSHYHDKALIETGRVGVKLSGKVRKDDVVEYCVSEGWVKVWVRDPHTLQPKKTMRGKYITITLKGLVEPFWKPIGS